MSFLFALESVMSRPGRHLWLNCVLAAVTGLVMAAITAGYGLERAGIVLTWFAILPLCLGVFFLADGIRKEMKANA
jgi:hypothetical protein